MSKPRVELQAELESIMNSHNVYFQPPATIMIKYPCIIYNLSDDKTRYANNSRYHEMNRYSAVLIDKDPDSSFLNELKKLPYCSFERTYIADNLNHFVCNIFY